MVAFVIYLYLYRLYYYVPLCVFAMLATRWERELTTMKRIMWNQYYIPRYTIKACNAYNRIKERMTVFSIIDVNIRACFTMLREMASPVYIFPHTSPTTGSVPNKNIGDLLTRLDGMMLDTIGNIPVDKLDTIKQNKGIQSLCGQIEMMMNNDRIKEKLKATNLEDKIKAFMEQVKKD